MSAASNYGCNTPSSYTFDNLEKVFANQSSKRLNEIKNINLTNYYRHDRNGRITRCLLCKITMKDNETFEHTRSLPHRNNKRFYNFVKNRYQPGDINFIVFNPEWVECRYCDNGLISNDHSQRINHIQETMHIEKREYCFERVNEHCKTPQRSTRVQETLFPLGETRKNISPPIVKENRVENPCKTQQHSTRVQETRYPLVEAQKNISRPIVKKDREENACTIRQHSIRVQDTRHLRGELQKNISAPIVKKNQAKDPWEPQQHSTLIRETRYPPGETPKNISHPIVRENRGEHSWEPQQHSPRIQETRSLLGERQENISPVIVREIRGENSLRSNHGPRNKIVASNSLRVINVPQSVMRPSPVVKETRNKVTWQNRSETYVSGDNYSWSEFRIDPYMNSSYSYTPIRPKKEDKMIPTWVWLGILSIIVYSWYRRS